MTTQHYSKTFLHLAACTLENLAAGRVSDGYPVTRNDMLWATKDEIEGGWDMYGLTNRQRRFLTTANVSAAIDKLLKMDEYQRFVAVGCSWRKEVSREQFEARTGDVPKVRYLLDDELAKEGDPTRCGGFNGLVQQHA